MKSLFDPETQSEIVGRINSLSSRHTALWGKMNVYQMVKHCVLAERHYHGQLPVDASAGLNLADGPKWLNLLLGDDQPMRQNAPTNKAFVVEEVDGDLEAEIVAWKAYITAYKLYNAKKYSHWFFGDMTRQQLGELAYKHNDHHLRQFGL